MSQVCGDCTYTLKFSLAQMPVPPAIIVRCDAVVNKIADHLISGDITHSRVCILAPGGMGKTSTALTVMKHPSVLNKFGKECQFWVPCISTNSPSTFLAHLSRYLGMTRQTGHLLDDILATLKTTEDPQVILIDNFETPWHPIEGNQESVKDVLCALTLLPHIAILVTMRSKSPPLDEWIYVQLSHVEPQDSWPIYTAIDLSASNDPKLDELLQVLCHLPYAITFMAMLGKCSLLNPERLLKWWNETGTGMLSKVQGGMDHSIKLSLQFVDACDVNLPPINANLQHPGAMISMSTGDLVPSKAPCPCNPKTDESKHWQSLCNTYDISYTCTTQHATL